LKQQNKAIIIAAIALIFVILGGSLAFMLIEGFTFIDAVWLVIISITTVGFGDIVPKTVTGRIIVLFIVISGLWLFTYVFGNFFSSLVEGQLIDLWGNRKMMKKVQSLNNHIIVCGAGRVGYEVVMELKNHGTPFVVIEKEQQRFKNFQGKEILHIDGDATEDKTLELAGIQRAKGIIISLADDTGNLFVTMSARTLNPGLKIITRANKPENINKIKRAGANSVFCPSLMAGKRMALSIIKPASVAYVQALTDTNKVNLELEELILGTNSPMANVPLKDSGMREKFNTLLLAVKRDDETILNPDPDEVLLPGDIMIVCGPADELSNLEKLAIG
jgi:voltage-gated potassium channel